MKKTSFHNKIKIIRSLYIFGYPVSLSFKERTIHKVFVEALTLYVGNDHGNIIVLLFISFLIKNIRKVIRPSLI